jgi:hypothetical protein
MPDSQEVILPMKAISDLPPLLEGLQASAWAVSAEGVAAILVTDAKPRWVWFDGTRVTLQDTGGRARILSFGGSGTWSVSAPFSVPSKWNEFELLPTGGWVVVDGVLPVGTIYNQLGKETCSFQSGGSVAFVQADSLGRIWIGHDDDSPESIIGGLSLFDDAGRQVWYHNNYDDDQIGPIGLWCCYALNVSDAGVYCQFYDGMLVTKVDTDAHLTHWRALPRGARALVVLDNQVGLVGRYDDDVSALFLYRLDAPGSHLLAKFVLNCDGRRLTYKDPIFGRGENLYAFANDKLYRLSLTECVGGIR